MIARSWTLSLFLMVSVIGNGTDAHLAFASGDGFCSVQAENISWAGRSAMDSRLRIGEPDWRVGSSLGLSIALRLASPGDVIELDDGVYDLGTTVVRVPVTLTSKTRWGALLTGSTVLELRGAGSVVHGLDFSLGGATSRFRPSRHQSMRVLADNIRIIDNRFTGVGLGSDLTDRSGITIELSRSQNTVIERNLFRRSRGLAIKSDDHSIGTHIVGNDFIDSPSFGGAGEVAHLGDALSTGQNQSPHDDSLQALFERNFVCRWSLESELISIKSNDNVISRNYFVDNQASAIVIRMGSRNLITDNIMDKNRGFPVRISGENNRVVGNSFSGSGHLVFLHAEVDYQADQAKNLHDSLKRDYWAANNNVISHNKYWGYTMTLQVQGVSGKPWAAQISPQRGKILNIATNNIFRENLIVTPRVNEFKNSLNSIPSHIIQSFDNTYDTLMQ